MNTTQHLPRAGRPGRKLLFGVAVSAFLMLALESVLWILNLPTLEERQEAPLGDSGHARIFERDGEGWRTRPELAGKVFNVQSFAAAKANHGIRIFSLGGSSVYGFPWDADVAFPAILGDLLLAASQDGQTIESINAGGMSYSMTRLEAVAEGLLQYEPDGLIVFSGHNEFVESIYLDQESGDRGALDRIHALIGQSRLAGLMDRWLPRADPEASLGLDPWVRRETVEIRATQRRKTVQRFEQKLTELVRQATLAGAWVIVASVPCNLREWAPQKSVLPEGIDGPTRTRVAAIQSRAAEFVADRKWAQAIPLLRQGLELAPQHAILHYQLGKCFDELGDYEKASEFYDRACDFDAYPIRRISAINQAARKVAAAEGAVFVDVDAIFRRESPHGLVGFELIEDYVHPTLAGHELVAWQLFRALQFSGFCNLRNYTEKEFQQLLAKRQRMPVANASFLFNQGVVLEHQGQEERALQKYEAAVAINAHPGALGNLARLYFDRSRIAEAERLLRALLQQDPEHPGALNDLGTVLQAQGKAGEAIPFHKQALSLKPGFRQARYQLGRALAAGEEYAEAEPELRRALQQATEAETGPIRIELARVARQQGRLGDAERHLRAVLEQNSESVPAHHLLGSLLAQQQALEGAEEQFRKALGNAPDNAEIRNDYANVLQRQGRFQEAVYHYQAILEHGNPEAGVHFNLGNALQAIGDFEQAVEHYDRALKLDPGMLSALQQKGLALGALQQFDRSIHALNAALELDSAHAETHLALSMLHRRLQQSEAAWDHAKRAVQSAPRDARIQFNYAELLELRGQFGAALEAFREAQRANATWPLPWARAALLLATHLGELEQAAVYATRAESLSEENEPWSVLAVAAVLEGRGRARQAEHKARQAQQLARARNDSNLLARIERMFPSLR